MVLVTNYLGSDDDIIVNQSDNQKVMDDQMLSFHHYELR